MIMLDKGWTDSHRFPDVCKSIWHVCMAPNAICCVYTVFRIHSTQVHACTVSVTYPNRFSFIWRVQSVRLGSRHVCLALRCLRLAPKAICAVYSAFHASSSQVCAQAVTVAYTAYPSAVWHVWRIRPASRLVCLATQLVREVIWSIRPAPGAIHVICVPTHTCKAYSRYFTATGLIRLDGHGNEFVWLVWGGVELLGHRLLAQTGCVAVCSTTNALPFERQSMPSGWVLRGLGLPVWVLHIGVCASIWLRYISCWLVLMFHSLYRLCLQEWDWAIAHRHLRCPVCQIHQEINEGLLKLYITLPLFPCVSTCIILIHT